MGAWKLKPCPFCGSVDLDTGYVMPIEGPCYRYVYCKNCGSHGPQEPKATTEAKAIKLWNERHTIIGDSDEQQK